MSGQGVKFRCSRASVRDRVPPCVIHCIPCCVKTLASNIPSLPLPTGKDVAVAVINAGGFAAPGEAMHTPDRIAADIHWIRDRVGGKPFGIDLVLPASVPEDKSVEELMAMIPPQQREFERAIKTKYQVPDPKQAPDLYSWGGLDQKRALKQLDVVFDERVPVFASGTRLPRLYPRPRPPARHAGVGTGR